MLSYIVTAVLYKNLSIEYKSEKYLNVNVRLFLVAAQDKMGGQVEKSHLITWLMP